MSRIEQGEIVRHFKYETLTREQKQQNKYLYRIVCFAKHSETDEQLVVYQALYEPFQIYARPTSSFFGKVDVEKYPYINQKYRFERHESL